MTNNPNETTAAAEHNTDVLPEYWPEQVHAEPERAVWMPWPIALLLAPLFWLMPKRMGPHFAAASWWAPIMAQLTWTIYGIGCISMTFIMPRWTLMAYLTGQAPGQEPGSVLPLPTLSEILRSPLALLAGGLGIGASEASSGGYAWGALLAAVLTIAALVAAFVFLGGLLMPYVAAGERTRRLLGRSVRLGLWATSSLAVLGLALQGALLIKPKMFDNDLLIGVIVTVYVAWVVWMMIRSGMRYAGEAEGPGWQDLAALCEGCGYALTGLTLASRCPECGRAVTDSLPEHRQPSAFAAANGVRRRIAGFCRTLVGALFGRNFYERVEIHRGYASARRFAIWVIILIGLICGVAGFYATAMYSMSVPRLKVVTVLNALSLSYGIVSWIYCAIGLLVVISAICLCLTRFGYRPLRPRATAVFYWSAWSVPVIVVALLTIYCFSWLLMHGYLRGRCRVPGVGVVDAEWFYAAGFFMVPLAVLVVALLRLRDAIRQTRYANR